MVAVLLSTATTVTAFTTVVSATSDVVTFNSPRDRAHYALGAIVRASYSCAGSAGAEGDYPLKSCTGSVANGEPLDTTVVGTQTFTVRATYRGGDGDFALVESVSFTVDAPSQAIIQVPGVGATFDQNHLPKASYRCVAGSVALSSCLGTDTVSVDGILKTVGVNDATTLPSTVGIHTLKVVATDAEGTAVTATRQYTVVAAPAATPPQVTITTPKQGAVYEAGKTPKPSFSCTAGSSAITSCKASDLVPATSMPISDIGSPYLSSIPGLHTYTVTATDSSGRSAKKVVTYTVKAKPVIVRADAILNGVGDNIYGVLAKQTVTMNAGTRKAFTLMVQNDGTTNQRMSVVGLGRKTDLVYFGPIIGHLPMPVATIRYYEICECEGKEVTAAVVAGTYRTKSLGSGQAQRLRMVIDATPQARSTTIPVTINTTGSVLSKDAVRVQVT